MLMNDPTLIEYLLSDEVFSSVAGIFEYDKALRVQGQYRHFLFTQARHVEVVVLSADTRSTAKFLFRLRYLKETMLHPTIDEPGLAAIHSMILFTSCEIAAKVQLVFVRQWIHVCRCAAVANICVCCRVYNAACVCLRLLYRYLCMHACVSFFALHVSCHLLDP